VLRKAGGRGEYVGVLALKFKETSEIGLMTVITVVASCQELSALRKEHQINTRGDFSHVLFSSSVICVQS